MRSRRLLTLCSLLSLCLIVLGSCSSTKKAAPQEPQADVNTLYGQAAEALDAQQYLKASRLFEEVERQHPYSQWSTQAQIMAAYSYYENESYNEAIISLDRFIQLHPGNDNVDYAYYLRALSFYEQISDVSRDQMMTDEAMKAFDVLIKRFPDSKYTRDAALKKDLTLDHLAGKEMQVGRYYLNRGHINAALNRFLAVVENYQTTSHIPEALHRLVEGYLTLGLSREATRVAAVLGHNYPGSEWYERSYALLDEGQRSEIVESRSNFDRAIDSLFKPD